MIRPASKSTLHDNILVQLLDAIRSGVWKPGEKLPGELELADRFHVSRNSIREVLKALVLSGVLKAHPGQGTFVTADAISKLDGDSLASTIWGDASLWDMKEVRLLLEGHIAYLAAKRATPDQLKKLKNALERVEPDENITESHARFHGILSTMADNPLLTTLLNSVQNKMDEQRRLYSSMPRAALETFDQEHAYIFEMVKKGKPEEAREAMIEHIEAAWTDSLYADLKKKSGPKGKKL
jgi:Transcriptional regulators